MRLVRFRCNCLVPGLEGATGWVKEVSDDMAAFGISRGVVEYADSDRDKTEVKESVPEEPEVEIEEPKELSRPYGNASKASWVAWAIHCGADPEEASNLSKVQLMTEYGERL